MRPTDRFQWPMPISAASMAVRRRSSLSVMEVLVLEVAMLQSRHFWLERTNTIPHVRVRRFVTAIRPMPSHPGPGDTASATAYVTWLPCSARRCTVLLSLPSNPLSAELIHSSGVMWTWRSSAVFRCAHAARRPPAGRPRSGGGGRSPFARAGSAFAKDRGRPIMTANRGGRNGAAVGHGLVALDGFRAVPDRARTRGSGLLLHHLLWRGRADRRPAGSLPDWPGRSGSSGCCSRSSRSPPSSSSAIRSCAWFGRRISRTRRSSTR